jgi:hypothetical protein
MMLANLSSSIQVTMEMTSAPRTSKPELCALLEHFVSSSNDIAYATVLNADAKGISAGRLSPTLPSTRTGACSHRRPREARVQWQPWS